MRIANNIPALTTALTLKATDRQLSGAMLRLSSGSKINSAKDDSAGLAIANKLSIQVSGLNRASQNSMDGISLIQTADGSMDGVSNILQRMRELAVQAANGVLEPSDKSKIQLEINQLIQEINDNANKTEFNKIKILSGETNTLSL
ncbi:MAG: flagellin, partial [Clostridiales bacterium]|nr:flagellin [Clostridiales bacterium]